ncbi:MAG: hypothetical protein PHT49_07420 [Desulfovibrionales bacterium]|nr:hypothetical protein [Desulfovibrionales bacterium]
MLKNICSIIFCVTIIIVIGCAPTKFNTKGGIKSLNVLDADPNTYAIVLVKLPFEQIDYLQPPALVERISDSWYIQRKGDQEKAWFCTGGGVYVNDYLHPSRTIGIYPLEKFERLRYSYFAFLVPAGEYVITYHFPSNTFRHMLSVDFQNVFSKAFYATPGKVIYLGRYKPVVEEEEDGYVNTYTIYYKQMDIISNYEDDISNLRKNFPELFTKLKFTAEDFSIGRPQAHPVVSFTIQGYRYR